MHLSTFAALSTLTVAGLASPEARVVANNNRNYYGGGGGNGYDSNPNGGGNQQPMTSIWQGYGRMTVPSLSGSAPVVSATAYINGNGGFVDAQLTVQAIGNGPGICPQASTYADGPQPASFTDANSGRNYNLLCNWDIPNEGNEIEWPGLSWNQCLAQCAKTRNCDSVVYSKLLWVCWTKTLAAAPNAMLGWNTDRYFAYLPSAQRGAFKPFSLTGRDVLLSGKTTAPTTTKAVPATGSMNVTVTGAITTLTAINATAAVANATTVLVNILMGMGGR